MTTNPTPAHNAENPQTCEPATVAGATTAGFGLAVLWGDGVFGDFSQLPLVPWLFAVAWNIALLSVVVRVDIVLAELADWLRRR